MVLSIGQKSVKAGSLPSWGIKNANITISSKASKGIYSGIWSNPRLCVFEGEKRMIQIFKKIDENNFQLVEEMQDDLALAQRLIDLRKDGSEYRAEKKEGSTSTVLQD